MSSDVVRSAHHVTRHNMPIHNTLSTAFQLRISQKALETLPEDGNVMSKHVGATIHTVQSSVYSHAPLNDVSVNDGPQIRRWFHKLII